MSKQNRALNLQLSEEFREDHFRFMMHEVNGAFLPEPLRFAVPVTRIHQHPATRGLCYSFREILPHRDGAQTFVEHHNRGIRPGPCRWIAQGFQPLAIYREELEFRGCPQVKSPKNHLENRFSKSQICGMLIGARTCNPRL